MMKQQQQHWENMVNMYINNKCLFTRLYPRFANRGKRTRRKKREHRHGRFFSPLSFNFTHRGAASMLKCYTTIDSLFFSLPLISSSSLENKKKEREKGTVVDRTRHAELRGKMPESLYYQCSVSSRNRLFLDARAYQRDVDFVARLYLYTPPCQSCDRTVNRGTMRERVNGINQTRD